jgi:NAD-dependent dihydropyrimidine dehydrogenase PreA subunit
MTHVVCEPCRDCKSRNCVSCCPVDCFFESEDMLVINPEECTDCAVCVSVCPTGAIFHEDLVPDEWLGYVEKNYDLAMEYYQERCSKVRKTCD